MLPDSKSPDTSGALAVAMRETVSGEVRWDAGSRALYATDASNYRQVPLGIVIPNGAGDVEAALAVARRDGASVFGRGGGTSLAGQCCNTAIVLDFSKRMNRILEVDARNALARVQPGVVLDNLRAAARAHGLTFGPDPATHAYCTLGGMIGNNSCGVHSVMAEVYGPGPTTAHNVEALDIVTYRGLRLVVGRVDEGRLAGIVADGGPRAELLRRLKSFQEKYADLIRQEFPRIPRRVSGYNLPALLPENGFHIAQALVGSESTLALVVEVQVRLIPAMPERVLVVAGFEDVFTAADHVPRVMAHRPVGLEGFDEKLVRDLREAGLDAGHVRRLPEGRGWLLVEFGGDSPDEALARARECAAAARELTGFVAAHVLESPSDQHSMWQIRESGLAATARVSSDRPTSPGWEDSAVPPERFGAYLRDIDALFKRYGYHADLYGHFGQGCLHCRIDFDLQTREGVATFRRFMEDAADLVHRYGGSLSGEHGDGQARGELLGRMFSREMLEAFREFKSIWDPDWRMNPGKVIDANPLDANLRLGPSAREPQPRTWFAYPEDHGSFAQATRRCVGVGKCRKTDAGTMCPSYMVTLEEQHSTRGRARLLFEMLEGESLGGGWDSEPVHDALDLCLACKGCKGECPMHVDMATYKAEFLAHYYEHRWRPRSAYAFGLVRTWARIASHAPRLVNFFSQTPGLRAAAKFAAGMPVQRRIPAFAPETFRDWFQKRSPQSRPDTRRVILWPDTFNDHFHPETLRDAVDVLEAAGFEVDVPPVPLCCGRPLYDFGMLRQARRRLEDVQTALRGELAARTPIVILEPSCLSVFRDELVTLFPDQEDARRLKDQTFALAEILAKTDALPPARLQANVLVHGHCHQKALFGMDAERAVLDRIGAAYEVLDSGCCGMAGAFGFERDHYRVSRAVGERVLLPAVRGAAETTVVMADGFSCREQIAQNTRRRAMHFAQVLHMAMATRGPMCQGVTFPERKYVVDHSSATLSWRRLSLTLAITAGVAAGVALLARGARRHVLPRNGTGIKQGDMVTRESLRIVPDPATEGSRKALKGKARRVRRPAAGGEALVRSVTVKPKARKPTKTETRGIGRATKRRRSD